MKNTEGATEMTNETTIPCGWCDTDVAVDDDHGQIAYCSDVHARLDGYIAEAEGNL